MRVARFCRRRRRRRLVAAAASLSLQGACLEPPPAASRPRSTPSSQPSRTQQAQAARVKKRAAPTPPIAKTTHLADVERQAAQAHAGEDALQAEAHVERHALHAHLGVRVRRRAHRRARKAGRARGRHAHRRWHQRLRRPLRRHLVRHCNFFSALLVPLLNPAHPAVPKAALKEIATSGSADRVESVEVCGARTGVGDWPRLAEWDECGGVALLAAYSEGGARAQANAKKNFANTALPARLKTRNLPQQSTIC